MDDPKAFGKRLREVRIWRELNLREAAGLAGRSFSFWGQVERGEKPVTNRNTLEAMASALRVHPTELTGQPYTRADSTTSEAHAVVTAVEGALSDYELGEPPADIQLRPWEAIAADLDRLNRDPLSRADFATQGAVLPSLLAQLHATYVTDPARRREVLVALLAVYQCAAFLTKCLGVRGLPMLATVRAARVADELDDPVWSGMVAFMRGASSSTAHRPRQYRQSVAAADALRPHAEALAPQRIATTRSSAKRSPTCCVRPGATPAAVSCAAWPGVWESPRSGEYGRAGRGDPGAYGPQSLRSVLAYGVSARSRSGCGLYAGAVTGEEKDRGLAAVVGHATVGDVGQLPLDDERVFGRVWGVQPKLVAMVVQCCLRAAGRGRHHR